jgi:hypothetical protein
MRTKCVQIWLQDPAPCCTQNAAAQSAAILSSDAPKAQTFSSRFVCCLLTIPLSH